MNHMRRDVGVTRADEVRGAPVRIVVMGVAGAGKSTVGAALAHRLQAGFLDADAVHPVANIAKMAAGMPLTDEDRRPWLAALCDALVDRSPIVVTCSALRASYRDVLRTAGAVRFVFLDLSPGVALDRVGKRADHFMAPDMVAGQFETLERPGPDEADVLTVDATVRPSALVAQICASLELDANR